MTMTVHGIDIVVGNERRAAIDIAREFVREQSEGEWTEEQIKDDASRIADLMIAFADKRIAAPGWQGIEADEDRIAAWVTDRFGSDSLDNAMERADRLLEEAIEMQQAVYAAAGCYPEVAIRRANDLVQHVNAKPAGDPKQEMGGVMTCALALGRRLGVRLDLAAQDELTRIEGLSKAHFDKRHQAKVDAGVAAQHERP